MSDISARLREVIEGRLRVAREAGGDTWATGRSRGYRYSRPGDVYAIAHDGTPARIAEGTGCGPDISAEQSSDHIGLSNPADAILAGERDLAVLERHRPTGPTDDPVDMTRYCTANCMDPWPCEEIEAMAKRYGVGTDD